MKRTLPLLLTSILIASCATNDNKATAVSTTTITENIEKNLAITGIEQKILSAQPTEVDNIYYISAEGIPSFFSDSTGKYIIQGQIVEIGKETPIDLTTKLISKTAKDKLSSIDKKDMITYPAKGETKASIYVFTDVDCPYCTQLHEEIEETNRLGIEVNYLAFPRMEMSLPKMEKIWCATDKKQAMDSAKSGDNLDDIDICENPVREQIELGISLGVNGTPGIFTESGQRIGGYMPSAKLARLAIENK